jgi:hypothetical protein
MSSDDIIVLHFFNRWSRSAGIYYRINVKDIESDCCHSTFYSLKINIR